MNRRIRRIAFRKLRNGEWYNFFLQFKAYVEKYGAETLGISELFTIFVGLLAQADPVLRQLQASALTPEVVELDDVRDDIFRGLAKAIESASHSLNAERRGAAKRLLLLLDHYGNLAVKRYDEETAGIINLVQELKTGSAADAALVGINEWVNDLATANTAFNDAVIARNAEDAQKSDAKMLDLRRRIDRAYLDIVERLEALILVNGDQPYTAFTAELNANIDRYKALIERGGKQADTSPDTSLNTSPDPSKGGEMAG